MLFKRLAPVRQVLCRGEGATDPPELLLAPGRKGVTDIYITDSIYIEVIREGKTYMVPSSSVRHALL